MAPANPRRLRLVALPASERPRRRRGWRLPALLGSTTVAALSVAAFAAAPGPRGLSHDERATVLARTVENLRALCAAPRDGELEDRCRELAVFASQFGECRGECATLVRRELDRAATR